MVKLGRYKVFADTEQSFATIDIHKELKKSGSMHITQGGALSVSLAKAVQTSDVQVMDSGNAHAMNMRTNSEVPIDFKGWLPFAAKKYKISPNIEDYVITPVIAVPADIPNRNRIAFPLKALLEFDPEMGMQAYRTWVGKPTYKEHVNDVIEDAYGVIIDSALVKASGWGSGRLWKQLMLAAYDRTKYTDYVQSIVDGDNNAYSMGAYVNKYTCSVCGEEIGRCFHVEKRDLRQTLTDVNGVLAFKNCWGLTGFELSSVGTPAWVSAISDHKMEFSANHR